MLKLTFVSIGILFTISTVARAEYSASDADMNRLYDVQTRLATAIGDIQKDYNDPQVIPRERDRRLFKEAMQHLAESLAGPDGIDGWVKGVTNKLPPQPNFVKKDITGFYAVGVHDLSQNQGQASNELNKQCDLLTNTLKEVIGREFDSFSCGTPQNVSPYASVGYYQYAASGTLRIRVPAHWNLEEVNGGTVSGPGGNLTKDPGQAYTPWRDACVAWLKKAKQDYPRMIAASCGTPTNVSQYKSVGYFEFQSTAKLYLK